MNTSEHSCFSESNHVNDVVFDSFFPWFNCSLNELISLWSTGYDCSSCHGVFMTSGLL